MSGHLTLGIDIGTTNVKACILDTRTNTVVASGFQEHPLFLPKPGYAEQEGDNYWKAVVAAIKQCLEQGPYAENIAAVGISGLVGVTLPISEDGRPIRPGMIWMDSRSEAECQEIRTKVGEDKINFNNGNRIAPWFIEPKALWMKNHEPELFEKTYKFLSPAGYCTYKLCGEFTINTGDAGLFYPYDYQNERWNPEIAHAIGIPIEKYPKIYRSYEVVGEVTSAAASETGLKKGTLLVAGGTDISSAALGSGVTVAGQAFYSMGTGSNLGIIIPTEQRVHEYRILKWPHVIPGLTMFDGPMAFTGASLKWFADMFGDDERLIANRAGINEYDLLTKQADRVSPGADGQLFLPFLGNTLSPNWNSNAKGVFFGTTLRTTRAHMIRAIIEGIAFDLYSNVKIAIGAGVKIDKLILNGGPTKSAFWNQITANVINIPLETTNINEAAPLGDAILAAKGAGIYDNIIDPLKDIVKTTGTIEPDQKIHEMYEEFFAIRQRVYQNLTKEMDDLHALLYKYHVQ
ncbi:xylulokinase [Desulfosporosinus youngiae]|uniref:Pentulose/hexulose kinase n=1 Tax=Desulfosporosinus youngiae DSM 17734 TaxID=768710 RepID=H5Y0F8_9FIRM|nr:FGGY family carbohydrate kinase [Desulfosporosinus youngiae]EHQ92214.1 pentulose/hexulose kinase [Desulfosporosinus youngiae DSM 17734]